MLLGYTIGEKIKTPSYIKNDVLEVQSNFNYKNISGQSEKFLFHQKWSKYSSLYNIMIKKMHTIGVILNFESKIEGFDLRVIILLDSISIPKIKEKIDYTISLLCFTFNIDKSKIYFLSMLKRPGHYWKDDLFYELDVYLSLGQFGSENIDLVTDILDNIYKRYYICDVNCFIGNYTDLFSYFYAKSDDVFKLVYYTNKRTLFEYPFSIAPQKNSNLNAFKNTYITIKLSPFQNSKYSVKVEEDYLSNALLCIRSRLNRRKINKSWDFNTELSSTDKIILLRRRFFSSSDFNFAAYDILSKLGNNIKSHITVRNFYNTRERCIEMQFELQENGSTEKLILENSKIIFDYYGINMVGVNLKGSSPRKWRPFFYMSFECGGFNIERNDCLIDVCSKHVHYLFDYRLPFFIRCFPYFDLKGFHPKYDHDLNVIFGNSN